MLNRKVFSEGMAALCEVFEREANDVLMKVYYEVLKGLKDEQFKSSVAKILGSNVYGKLPRPAEILESVNGKAEDKAILAVTKIERAIREIGAYSNVCFDDPLIHVVIKSNGGWTKLCEITSEEWKFLKRDIEKHYRALLSVHNAHLDIPKVLIGLHGGENEAALKATGKEIPITYIGDKAKALAWTSEIQKQIANV